MSTNRGVITTSLQALLAMYGEDGAILLLLFVTLIQVAPIKINPWSWIAKSIGRAINGEVIEKVDNLSVEVNEIKADAEKREADQCRVRILRFNDELIHAKEVRHTKEHFDQTLNDIKKYETYCADHSEYKNHIADDAIGRIKRIYKECGDKGTFA